MSLLSAFCTGPLKAFGSMMETAIPSAPEEMAVFIAETISPTSLFADPVHWCDVPKMASASEIPYCVGTKKGFVVTWLTKTHFLFGVFGQSPTPPLVLPPPQP